MLCRFWEPGEGPRLGWVEGGRVYDLTATGRGGVQSLATALQMPHLRSYVESLRDLWQKGPSRPVEELEQPPRLEVPHWLPPVDYQEVWGAGVTYLRSREAREEESGHRGLYDQVYAAPRPELFFKATPHRVVGPWAPVRVRADSSWTVPEPEFAFAISPDFRLVGVTIGNDMSARDIEGENPLYLPQAKIYNQCCALGPALRLIEPGQDLSSLTMRMTLFRGGQVLFQGETSLAQMKRTPQELVEWLRRENSFPYGVILLSGTGIVPPDEVALQDGDEVLIEVPGLGQLRNPVAKGG